MAELGADLLEIPVEGDWGITGSLSGDPFCVNRFLPHKTKGEGFFLAVLQKKEAEYTDSLSGKAAKFKVDKSSGNQKKQSEIPASVRTLIKNPEGYDFALDRQGKIRAFAKDHLTAFRLLEEKVRIVHAGIGIGEIKGKDLVPDISLALSIALEMDSVSVFSLNRKQAIDYLRREALVLSEDCPLGWVIMLYEGHPLGWMKNIGNRANNAYPTEWRIRSENPF